MIQVDLFESGVGPNIDQAKRRHIEDQCFTDVGIESGSESCQVGAQLDDLVYAVNGFQDGQSSVTGPSQSDLHTLVAGSESLDVLVGHHSATGNDQDALADGFDVAQDMSGEENGSLAAGQRDQELSDFSSLSGVESAAGLVEN